MRTLDPSRYADVLLVNVEHIYPINPYQSSVPFCIETSHLISSANQVTGFCMKCITGLKQVKASASYWLAFLGKLILPL